MGNMHSNSFLLFDMAPQSVLCPKVHELTFDIPSLTFDRVQGDHVTTSAFPLFRLPVELFSHILGYLSTNDLKSLGLVDRDCRRVTAPYYFKDMKTYFAPDKCSHLFREISCQATSNVPAQLSPSRIASCVRRLTVASDSPNRPIPDYSTIVSEYEGLPIEDVDIPLTSFLRSISSVVEKSLPNLHILDWDAPTFISPIVLDSVLSSPAKHLRLRGVMFKDDIVVSSPSPSLSLETLSLQVSWPSPANQRKTLYFFDDIFRRTASSLRQLIWNGYLSNDEIHVSDDMPPFPNLRSVSFDTVSSNSDKILRHFLGPYTRVETLCMDSMTTSTQKFYRTRGYIPSLKRFCWLNHGQGDASPYDDIILFLENNPQLEALHIPDPVLPTFIGLSLLPTLQSHFDALVSLHLVWASSSIHDESLQAISSISTLRHLWLSAGNQDMVRNTWEIDHASILKHLSPLARLEILAFSRDTYTVNAHPLAPRFCDYYASKALPVDLDISKYLSASDLDIYRGKSVDFGQGMTQRIEMRRLAWESWHAERMLAVANDYSVIFPALRWSFIGQLAMSTCRPGCLALIHTPPQREPCLASLHKKLSMTLWRPI